MDGLEFKDQVRTTSSIASSIINNSFVDLIRVRTGSFSPLSLRLFNLRDTGVYVCAANTVYTLPQDIPVFATANITVIGKFYDTDIVSV